MTPFARRAIIGSLFLAGSILIGIGWIREGRSFVSGLLLEVGAGLLLFAVLFVVEGRLLGELRDLRRDVGQQQATLESLRSLSRELVSQEYAAVADRLSAWEEGFTHAGAWDLLNHAQSVGAVSDEGVRVYLPGPDAERWMRLNAEGDTDHPRVLFAVEKAEGGVEARYEWHADRSPEDAVQDLFAMVRNTAAEWTGFDVGWILRQGLVPITAGLNARYRVPHSNWDLRPVVEVPDAQWAVTERGLECTTRYYAIDWWTLWEMDWIHHMSGKGWVNVDEFTTAFIHAQGYFADRRADADAERAAYEPRIPPAERSG